jgi:hypothetical protein
LKAQSLEKHPSSVAVLDHPDPESIEGKDAFAQDARISRCKVIGFYIYEFYMSRSLFPFDTFCPYGSKHLTATNHYPHLLPNDEESKISRSSDPSTLLATVGRGRLCEDEIRHPLQSGVV